MTEIAPSTKGKFREEIKLKTMFDLADEVYASLPVGKWVDVETFGTQLNKKSTPMKLAFGILLGTKRLKISDNENGVRVVKKI